MNKIKIIKNDDRFIFNLNGFDIHFCNIVNTETRANLWNFWGVYKDDAVICSKGTDIIGVLREKGEADFMGGVHGDETVVDLKIFADGKIFEKGSCECNRVDIVMFSHLTRVSTGENVIDRMVHIELFENSITVSTSFKCLVDNFNLEIAYNGGMFAWFDDMAEFQYTSAGPIVPDGDKVPRQVQSDKGIVWSVCKHTDALITVENLIGHTNDSYNGTAFYYGSEPHPRIKIYYSTDSNTVWNKGHICTGKAKYTLI